MIWRSGERGSGISVLAARHDDDDDDIQGSFRNMVGLYIKVTPKYSRTIYKG